MIVRNFTKRDAFFSDTDIILFCTTALCLFYGFNDSYYRDVLTLLFCLSLFRLKILVSPFFFFVISILSAIHIFENWYSADNHKYLFLYWVSYVALILNLTKNENDKLPTLALGAKYFIFLTMFGAFIQKTISTDYLIGDFFYYTFIEDERFEFITKLFVGNDYEIYSESVKKVKHAIKAGVPTDVVIPYSLSLKFFTDIVTWVNYLDQLVVSILIFFSRGIISTIKHTTFIIFILGTYLIAPVYGFGWILCIFGMCIAAQENRLYFFKSYIGCIVMLSIYNIVIGRFLF